MMVMMLTRENSVGREKARPSFTCCGLEVGVDVVGLIACELNLT